MCGIFLDLVRNHFNVDPMSFSSTEWRQIFWRDAGGQKEGGRKIDDAMTRHMSRDVTQTWESVCCGAGARYESRVKLAILVTYASYEK